MDVVGVLWFIILSALLLWCFYLIQRAAVRDGMHDYDNDKEQERKRR